MENTATNSHVRVLLIDDDPADRALVVAELKRSFSQVAVEQVFDAKGFEQALGNWSFSLVITDYHLRWTTGTKVLLEIKTRHPDVPVIMFTGTGSEEVAVEAMKNGLEDYVIKSPSHFSRLSSSAKLAITHYRERLTIRRIEQAIRETEQRYRLFVENFNGIVFSGGVDFRPTFCQGQVSAITGYTAQELCEGRPGWDQIVHPEYRERFLAEADLLRAEPGRSCEREYRIVRRDGGIRWVREIVQSVRAEDGGTESIQGIVYDIHERKVMEESLLRNEQLAAVGRIASGVAHEMNNPLANIAACASSLQSRLDELPSTAPAGPDVFERYLRIIFDETMRCKKILADLLDMVRDHPLSIQPLDLASFVSDTLGLMAMLPVGGNYSFEALSEGKELIVGTDRDRLRQVLVILLNNAMEAMPHGGRIAVGCRRTDDRLHFELTVSDEGPGVPAELKERIFEPFFTTKGQSTGVGLGLAVAANIVAKLGGKIGLVPAVSSGATFSVQLPAVLGEEPE